MLQSAPRRTFPRRTFPHRTFPRRTFPRRKIVRPLQNLAERYNALTALYFKTSRAGLRARGPKQRVVDKLRRIREDRQRVHTEVMAYSR